VAETHGTKSGDLVIGASGDRKRGTNTPAAESGCAPQSLVGMRCVSPLDLGIKGEGAQESPESPTPHPSPRKIGAIRGPRTSRVIAGIGKAKAFTAEDAEEG